jgi:hypothetical protein
MKETRVIPSKSVVAAVAALAVLISAQARAQTSNPVFIAFTTVCGEPAADFAAVRAAADAQGWGASDAKSEANMPGVTVEDTITRSKTAEKTALVMSAWHGAKGPVKVSDCTVHVAKADFAPLREASAAWLTFPAQESTSKKVIYRFTDAAGSHRALTSAEYDAAASGAGLEILTISGDANGTVLDLMMIKK